MRVAAMNYGKPKPEEISSDIFKNRNDYSKMG
jgi:hypothetical protein